MREVTFHIFSTTADKVRSVAEMKNIPFFIFGVDRHIERALQIVIEKFLLTMPSFYVRTKTCRKQKNIEPTKELQCVF